MKNNLIDLKRKVSWFISEPEPNDLHTLSPHSKDCVRTETEYYEDTLEASDGGCDIKVKATWRYIHEMRVDYFDDGTGYPGFDDFELIKMDLTIKGVWNNEVELTGEDMEDFKSYCFAESAKAGNVELKFE